MTPISRRLEPYVTRYVGGSLWDARPTRRAVRWLLRSVQLVVVIAEGFVRDRLLLRASALTFVSMLSLVPLLAMAVAVVEAIGVRHDLAGLLVERLTAGSPAAREPLLGLIQGVAFGQLGTLGAVTLFATTVLAIGNVERAFNQIWGVRQERSLGRRFSDYLAVLVVAPLLLAVALSMMTTLQSQVLVQRLRELPGFAQAYELGLRQVPTAVLAGAFTFLYMFLPNTRVRFASALFGGIVAAVLFTLAQWGYVRFNVGVARYNAVYGTFALIPLLFMWIYISWGVVLLGAEVAFAHQNLDHYRREVRGAAPGAATREAIGLLLAVEIGRRFRDGVTPWNPDALAEQLDVPVRSVREVLAALEAGGMVIRVGGEVREEGYQLGRPAERIGLVDVLATLRGERDPRLEAHETGKLAGEALALLEQAAGDAAGGRTLADLLERLPRVDPSRIRG
jgi:membrane protein